MLVLCIKDTIIRWNLEANELRKNYQVLNIPCVQFSVLYSNDLRVTKTTFLQQILFGRQTITVQQ